MQLIDVEEKTYITIRKTMFTAFIYTRRYILFDVVMYMYVLRFTIKPVSGHLETQAPLKRLCPVCECNTRYWLDIAVKCVGSSQRHGVPAYCCFSSLAIKQLSSDKSPQNQQYLVSC